MIYTYKVTYRPYHKENPIRQYTYDTETGKLQDVFGTLIREEKGLIASNYLSTMFDYEIVEITP